MNKVFISLLLSVILMSCLNDNLDIDMVFVKGGEFAMGHNDSIADKDEMPEHIVKIKDFYIGRYEVTQAQWVAVMGHNPSYNRGNNKPVEQVSWIDIEFFIKKLNKKTGLNYRLPTEAEWEYVAMMSYECDELSQYAWNVENSDGQSHNIGLLMPNELGIYDLIGNVNEWCYDSYDSLAYTKGIYVISAEKVFRGGCFLCEAEHCRVKNRNHVNREVRNYSLGLRLAMDVE